MTSLALNLLKAEPGGHEGRTNIWLTPRWPFCNLGPFDLDPCAAPDPTKWSWAKTNYTEADDGLTKPWHGIVWCNPPYGREIGKWVHKWCQHKNGFLLVAARPDTAWFHEAVSHADAIWFPRGRIRFIEWPSLKPSTSPAFASVVFAAGKTPTKRLLKQEGVIVRDFKQLCFHTEVQGG